MITKADIEKAIEQIRMSHMYDEETKENWLNILSKDYENLSEKDMQNINLVLAMHYLNMSNMMFRKEVVGAYKSMIEVLQKIPDATKPFGKN